MGDTTTETVKRLTERLLSLRRQISELRDEERETESLLAGAMTGHRMELDGLGLLERRRTAERKNWDHQALLAVVLARSRDERKVDKDTGEYEDTGEAAMRVLAECARFEWRLGPLRARHIQVDEFCESRPGRMTVQITEAKGSSDGV